MKEEQIVNLVNFFHSFFLGTENCNHIHLHKAVKTRTGLGWQSRLDSRIDSRMDSLGR